jgi:hypothetical protein
MTRRASDSLVAVLIRVGLLLALAIMLMAENALAASHSTQNHLSVGTQHTAAGLNSR